jgi:hypothetical protein
VNDEGRPAAPGESGGLDGFLGEHYRAWILDDARQQFGARPSSDEIRQQMHGALAPPPHEPPEVGSQLDVLKGGFPGSEVDVWFSAGPVGPVGWLDEPGQCDQGGTTACRLYKVRLNLAARTGTATKVLDLTGLRIGAVQPAINQRGQLAVVLQRGWDTVGHYAESAGLITELADGSTAWVRGLQSKAADRPEKPAWWGSDKLLWSANSGEHGGSEYQHWENLHLTEVTRTGVDSDVLLGGPDGSTAETWGGCSAWPSPECVSWRDPDVHRAPVAEAALTPGPWVAVFGDQGIAGTADSFEGRPIVARLPDGSDIQEFELGRDDDNVEIESCHHNAWGIHGSRILCTRENSKDFNTVPGLGIHALFKYGLRGSRWERDGYAVAPSDVTTDGKLPAFAGLATTQEPLAKDYPVLSYKYAHWLISDRWVVATVFITQGGSHSVFASRVVLFDTTGALDPWDLTDIIEDHEDAERGTWRATHSGARPPT